MPITFGEKRATRRGFVPGLTGPLPLRTLAAEKSLFSCDWIFARSQAGPLTQSVMDAIEGSPKIPAAGDAGLNCVIDVRVQRLMPGMFPSIPGWHCDGVPRPSYGAQPDFSLLNPYACHFTVIASTADDGVSRTEFLDEPIELTPAPGQPVWRELHRGIESRSPRLNTFRVVNGEIVEFDCLAPHRAMPTTTRGWRLFFRLSMQPNPPIKNAIPNAEQVYLLSEENGW